MKSIYDYTDPTPICTTQDDGATHVVRWVVTEQLYPVSRGLDHHCFDTEAAATLFLKDVKGSILP